MTLFSLDDQQMERLMAAASLLPNPHHRDAFLRSVAGRVVDIPNFGMAELESAIQFVLGHYGVAGGVKAFSTRSSKYRQLAEGVFK